MNAENAFDCKALLARPGDVDDIVAFYEGRRSNQAVYLRKREDIERSVKESLFLIVRNKQNQIIAASGVYLLNDGDELEESIIIDGIPQRGSVAELGSVLSWKEGLPKEKQQDGFWHPFLFSVPMVLLFHRLVKKNGLFTDQLVCDVQTDRVSNQQRLMGQVALTPLRWHMINPGKGLLTAFRNTVRAEDANVLRPKNFYQGFVGNLPRIAKYLVSVAKVGLTNNAGNRLAIDLSDLIENLIIPQNKVNLVDSLLANQGAFPALKHLGWYAIARQYLQIAPLRGEALFQHPKTGASGFSNAATTTTTPTPTSPPSMYSGRGGLPGFGVIGRIWSRAFWAPQVA